tara:strand:- start:5821 stop:6051 length:231 start_codon:yes stop_codon:yes gene_type:complete
MVSVTLAVPKELKQKMDKFPEMNWSEIARQAFNERIADLQFINKIKSKSTLTEADALRMGKAVSKAVSDRYRKLAG